MITFDRPSTRGDANASLLIGLPGPDGVPTTLPPDLAEVAAVAEQLAVTGTLLEVALPVV